MSESGKELMVSRADLDVSEGSGEAVDWVMVSQRNSGGGISLFASKTLTRVSLQRQVEGYALVPITARPDGPVARVPVETRTVVATMKDFTLVHAASLPDALRSLMELWDRDQPQS